MEAINQEVLETTLEIRRSLTLIDQLELKANRLREEIEQKRARYEHMQRHNGSEDLLKALAKKINGMYEKMI